MRYQLAPGVAQYVQAVYATIDATSATDPVRPTLEILEQSGVVIAKKRQGEAIPAGGTGSATWALRLDDDGGDIRYDRLNVGDWLYVETTGEGGPHNAGMQFVADTGEIEFDASDTVHGAFRVIAPFFYLDAGGGIYRLTNSNLFDLTADAATFNIGSGGAVFNMTGGGVFEADGNTLVVLPAAGTLEVRDSTNNPIFRVNEDGSLQGKTGKALTFNL